MHRIHINQGLPEPFCLRMAIASTTVPCVKLCPCDPVALLLA